MKNIFFILSTPRCRSTWFSNLEHSCPKQLEKEKIIISFNIA